MTGDGPKAHGNAEAPAFHLVIPSLPGHGFSGSITEAGWNDGRVAAALAELMGRLGYERYGVQGGDHGAFIGPQLGRVDTDHVIGVHANALVTSRPATRPIWRPSPMPIIEKFKEWIDQSHELPEQAIDQDRLLAEVSIYWFTDTARSVANFYYERFHDASMFAPKPKGTMPTGVAVFKDGDYAIRRFAEKAHNITHWSEFYSGGHFPAVEVPDLLVGDIREFLRTLI